MLVGREGVGYQLIDLWTPIAVAEGFDMNEDLFSASTWRDKSKSLLSVPKRDFSFSAHTGCVLGLTTELSGAR